MSDESRAELAHLLRRAAFAARPDELDAAERAGYAATVASFTSPGTDPAAAATPLPALPRVSSGGAAAGTPQRKAAQAELHEQSTALTSWWLDRMTATERPGLERLAWFWHGHYATSIVKVRSAAEMAAQNTTFRDQGLGAFDALTLAVVQGPAMLVWLDAQDNVKADPNENLGREMMELFTLGLGNYTETDVREAARCLTGWSFSRKTGAFIERAAEHDTGIKTVLGTTGNLDGTDLVGLITRRQQSARWVATRLWSRHVAPVGQGNTIVDALADSAPRTPAGAVQIAPLWRAVLSSPTFRSPATRGLLVADPVEFVVGALRQLRLRSRDHSGLVLKTLDGLGQVPFAPPSVGGWPSGQAWLSTSAALERARFAQAVARVGDLSSVEQAPAAERVDATAHLLSIDAWTPGTRAALASVAAKPPTLVALALCSPEYVTR